MHPYPAQYAHIYADTLAFITCPEGHTRRVSSKIHRIAVDGTLSPSWDCDPGKCPFHVFLVLNDWP
jgi:hypothetical protein